MPCSASNAANDLEHFFWIWRGKYSDDLLAETMPRRRRIVVQRGSDRMVREMVHSLGYRFTLKNEEVPGHPHLYFPSRKLALFVVHCHWFNHGCGAIGPNRSADAQRWCDLNARELASIQVVLSARNIRSEVIWDCEMKDPSALKKRLVALLGDQAGATR